LVSRRAAKSAHFLQADVDGFDEMLDRVLVKLAMLELESTQIVHGDICTPNLLVDEDNSLALLDWGFYTTAGDNTFDASTAAAFFDMYGPDARKIDDELLDRFEELGHDRARMYLYRAAYAITTATIYSEDAADGHYAWCVGNLNREDLRAAL
jgi:aminoglycoside phosphotransferase (APT) family kinase protein